MHSALGIEVGAAGQRLQAVAALGVLRLHPREDLRLLQHGARRVNLPQLDHLEHHLRQSISRMLQRCM